ncbi:MAG: PAS domain S-box protein [Pseudomonadota bacterium]
MRKEDGSEHRQLEAQLRNERDFAENLLNTAPAIVLVLDTQGRIERINPYMEALSGYTQAEVKGKDWFTTFLPKAIQEQTRTLFLRAINDIQTHGNRDTIVTRSGQERLIEWYDKTLKDAEGNALGLLAIGQDVTERNKAEQALVKSEQRLSEAQRIARLGNWHLDLASNRLEWSDEIFHIFEIDKEAFGATYESFLEGVHPDDRARVDKAYSDSVKNRQPYSISHRLLMADGRVKYVDERSETFYDEDGKPLYSVGTIQDNTELRLAEAQLSELNRDLEKRVEERTAELNATNQRLESFNELMADREMRVIEIKMEMNRLCRELGREPPYPDTENAIDRKQGETS